MLELTQEQLKEVKYNKINQIKAILKDFSSILKHNKYAKRKNDSLLDKNKIKCFIESDLKSHPFSSFHIKVYDDFLKTSNSTTPFIEYKQYNEITPWIKRDMGWCAKCIDKNGNEIRIDHNNDIYSVTITLLHIIYNKLKNKKRGHTHDDGKYIEEHKEYWKLMLERMEVSQELLETYHVKS
jgi:hypothetical protein